MGGKAFANLHTPRMPGEVYHEVKRRVEQRLSQAFSVVRFPIEGPAKLDFGDVDVFVTGPRFQCQGDDYTRKELLGHIGAALGATAVIVDSGVQEPSAHFAIPWPRDLEHLCDEPIPQEPTYAVAGPSTRPGTSSQTETPTSSSFSAQIDTSTRPSFSSQVRTSPHPDASAPPLHSPRGNDSAHAMPGTASPYATTSTPVTSTPRSFSGRSFSDQIRSSTRPSFSDPVSTSPYPDASSPTVRSPHDSFPTPSNASPYATQSPVNSTPRNFSGPIYSLTQPRISTQDSTSTHPGPSTPTVRSPHSSVPTPGNASPYATPSTPVTATTPTLSSFPAVPSAHSNAVTPIEFPLPRSRFDVTHAKPNQRPDWPRSTELEMTLPDREFRHVSGAQQRGGRSRSLPPVSQDPEQFAPRQSRRSRSSSARPYSRRGPSRWEQPPNENSNSQEESVSAPFSRLALAPAPHLPSSRPITPARGRRLHIQVDVQVFDSSSRLHYMLFHHAHGDIWQLLGNVIKPYGLTVDDKGLWLRIPEIEEADKKRSKVWLTGDPDEILKFLGLPYTRYWAGPFRDLYQMYEYVANCITFWVAPAAESEMALRANDRRRMKQRPAYRKWVEEFKPLCRAQGRFSNEPLTRDQVRGRAFARFNVRQTYMTERRAFLVEDQKRHILKTIIERIVPLPAEGAAKEDVLYRTVLVRALREIVLDWNRGLYSIMAPGNLRDDEGFYHLGRTESFVLEYKDRIGKEAMDLHNRRMEEKRAHEQPSRV
ncbi:hypothetical protein CEP51_013945 [Fusarium floridanum]|uniref:Uncharacterized protein n=1 Tax=Fusarium floridanum TaxID=1325733 RepID=A0A428Q1X9_9HYPO|nr:hypothetical protein CEP51_013945 [Fusarium floridanum]